MLLHNWTLHRSMVNTTARPRRGFSVCYIDAGTRQRRAPELDGIAAWPQVPLDSRQSAVKSAVTAPSREPSERRHSAVRAPSERRQRAVRKAATAHARASTG